MKILGIETSCDETGLAIYDSERGLVGHVLHSQVELHAEYGGVVPELASRDHVRKLVPLLHELLERSNLSRKDLNGVAYTSGPGLIGALLVGASFGRSFALGLDIPSVAVHHMEGHLLAVMLEEHSPEFPFLALLVSGGHTQLVRVDGLGRYQILGESIDDAVGEAFDKTAKMMDLGYPGGPEIARLAGAGVAGRYQFPRPMLDRPGLDFSFSGLKTFALNTYQNSSRSDQDKADIARAFEEAVIDTLSRKVQRALSATGLRRLIVAGGVGANLALRERLLSLDVEVFYPRPEFCTDNGAMIAYAGYLRLAAGQREPLEIKVRPRWPMSEMTTPSAGPE